MPDNDLHILQITDLHLLSATDKTLLGINTESTLHSILEMVSHHPRPDMILLTGDLAQDPVPDSYRRLLGTLGQLPAPCYCLPGNHDDFGLMQQILNSGNVSTADRIVSPGHRWQIIQMNSQVPGSESGHLREEEIDRLERYLSAAPETATLIAMHHHPAPVGSKWLDTMVVDNGFSFLEKLRQYPNAKGVLFGHIHQEYHAQYHGIQLIGSPSSCFQFKPQSKKFSLDAVPAGCRWLTLGEDGEIRTRVERADAIPEGFNFEESGY